jgi:hypothetical protein
VKYHIIDHDCLPGKTSDGWFFLCLKFNSVLISNFVIEILLLAIPVIAMLNIICDHIVLLKPYGFLIGEIESRRNKPALIRKIKKCINSRLLIFFLMA